MKGHLDSTKYIQGCTLAIGFQVEGVTPPIFPKSVQNVGPKNWTIQKVVPILMYGFNYVLHSCNITAITTFNPVTLLYIWRASLHCHCHCHCHCQSFPEACFVLKKMKVAANPFYFVCILLSLRLTYVPRVTYIRRTCNTCFMIFCAQKNSTSNAYRSTWG